MDAAMRPTRSRTCSGPRWPAVAAALATFVVSVALDLLGRASVGHIIVLGALSAVVGLLRIHRFGRDHRVAAFLASVVVLAQPSLHAAGEVWDRSAADLAAAHSAAHVGLLVVYVAAAVATVLVIAAIDVVLLACAEAVQRLAHVLQALIEPPARAVSVRPAISRSARAILCPIWAAYAVRRGPPQLVVAR